MTKRQLTKYEFEKLLWNARVDPLTKLIAKAIIYHMGQKNSACALSVRRIAYMCGVDERTIRYHLKPLEKMLGVEIVHQPGKVSTFKLRVFRTAAELKAVLESEAWKTSKWQVFSVERNPRKPDEQSELERLLADIETITRQAKGQLPLNGGSPLNGHSVLNGGSPTPEPSFRGPLNGGSPEPILEPDLNLTECASGAKAAKGRARKGSGATFDAEEFDRFVTTYRAALPVAQRGQRLRKDPTLKAWMTLSPAERQSAISGVQAYAHDAGEYMLGAHNYLVDGPWQGQVAAMRDADEYQVQLLAEVIAGQTIWTQGMTDKWGGPLGSRECSLPAEIEARARAKAQHLTEAASA